LERKLVYFHLNPLQSRRGFEVFKVVLRVWVSHSNLVPELVPLSSPFPLPPHSHRRRWPVTGHSSPPSPAPMSSCALPRRIRASLSNLNYSTYVACFEHCFSISTMFSHNWCKLKRNVPLPLTFPPLSFKYYPTGF
jgi:hypothetical protein